MKWKLSTGECQLASATPNFFYTASTTKAKILINYLEIMKTEQAKQTTKNSANIF
jgi:hypothetical protein